MLATAVHVLPRGEGWAYEFKWDGVRALIESSERGVRLFSRRGNEITTAYPELVGMLRGGGDAMLDGEIVAFVHGRPSFEALQTRMHVRAGGEARRLAEHTPVTFVAFDLLRRDGVELLARPYSHRRAELERWAAEHPASTLSPGFEDGAATEATAREHGLEGVVAKRTASAYRPGIRSRDWMKLRFVRAGDFVVIGWEAPVDAADKLSSLVLAMSTPDGLVFAGKAGSGLTARTADALHRRLRSRPHSAVAPEPPGSPGRVTRWVDPEVVVEIEFTLWTSEHRLRHPVFRRLREDKTIDEAVGDG
jgi:bifunctional non-homologous end joining protein LigD